MLACIRTLCKWTLVVITLCMLAPMQSTAEENRRICEAGIRLVSMPRDTEATDSVTAITMAYFTCDHSLLKVGEKATWTLTVNGEQTYAYRYDYILAYQPLEEESNEYEYRDMVLNGGTSFSATPSAPGRYFVTVTVIDQYGGRLEATSAFYIAVREDSPELADKVAEVVALCKANGYTSDEDIALFMHDYLINNACYDLSYTYFYPEGVLLHGTGVCQSYSLAYQILMEEMGIDCLYVTGTADGVSHSWNLVNLGGRWYHVDCTWDDPIMVDANGNVIPGGERHDYFCIYDKEMVKDHTWEQMLYPESDVLVITEQPRPVCVFENQVAAVSFTAVGDGLSYVWYEKPAGESAFKKSMDYTGNTFTTKMNAERDGSQIYCVVTDIHGNTVTTKTVEISMEKTKYPETEHPYKGHTDRTWTYQHPDDVYALKVTFSEQTAIVRGHYLLITSADGRTLRCIQSNPRGDIYLLGDQFSLRLLATGAGNDWYGFAVTAIEGLTKEEYEAAVTPRYTIDENGKITGYRGHVSKVVIPSEINGIQVTGIGDGVFQRHVEITSVTIPDSVTSIDNSVFAECSNLTSVDLGSGLKTMGHSTFMECTSLKSIVLPEGVTTIGENTFLLCIGMTSIHLPDSLRSIGKSAFNSCESLTTLHIPDTVTYMETDHAFAGCASLTSVHLPDSITEIGPWMFHNCRELKSIKLPENITKIGDYAFYECYGLTSIYLPDGVESIGNWAFVQCIFVKELRVPDSVQSIGEYAFYNCNSLRSVHIPDGITRIERNAFYQAWSLTEIRLPDSITYIGEQAFLNCYPLARINIPEGVTYIGEEAFSFCSLQSIVIPSSVTAIGANAFAYQLSSVSFITVPQNSYAQAWCKNNNWAFRFICDTHTWQEGTVTKEPTVTEPGVLTYSCSVCGVTKEDEIPVYSRGDVDCNRIVDVCDALLVLQYIAGWDVTVNTANADVTSDGTIGISDVLKILQDCMDGDIAKAMRALQRMLADLGLSNLEITLQPADQYVMVGEPATFTVAATGDGLKYQWYIDRNDGDGWQKLNNAVDAAHVTSKVDADNDGYRYRCMITDAHGSEVTTDTVVLHVVVDLPNTGDASMPGLWLAMCMLSVIGLIILKRREGIE